MFSCILNNDLSLIRELNCAFSAQHCLIFAISNVADDDEADAADVAVVTINVQ